MAILDIDDTRPTRAQLDALNLRLAIKDAIDQIKMSLSSCRSIAAINNKTNLLRELGASDAIDLKRVYDILNKAIKDIDDALEEEDLDV